MEIDKNRRLEENEVLKKYYKLKINLEKKYKIKKKKPKKLTKYEKKYKEAKELKSKMLKLKIFSNKMITTRTDYLYNLPEFKQVVKIGNEIRIHENTLFVSMLTLSCFLLFASIVSSYLLSNIVFLLIYPLLQAFLIYIFNPKIKYKDFYNKIYMPLCYFCANFGFDENVISFKIYDLKQNWDKKTLNKELVTNKFKVRTLNSLSTVEKKIIRNKITTYSIKKGILYIGSKLATIFSGYVFNMEYNNGKEKNSNDLKIAIINKNTLYGTLGLKDESLKNMRQIHFNMRHLEDEWLLYVDNNYEMNKKVFNEIQKKIIMISNEIGIFNAYISDNAISFLLGIQVNRNGIDEDFFESSIRNSNGLKYGGFISIVKTIYIIHCMYKLVGIIYPDSEIVYEKKRLHKVQKERQKEKQRKPRVEELINKLKSKKAAFHMDTAVKIFLSLVISGLIFLGFYSILEKSYAPGMNDQYSKTYISQSSTINESTLNE